MTLFDALELKESPGVPHGGGSGKGNAEVDRLVMDAFYGLVVADGGSLPEKDPARYHAVSMAAASLANPETRAMYVHHFVVSMTAAKDEAAREKALDRLCRRPEVDSQEEGHDQEKGDEQEEAGPA